MKRKRLSAVSALAVSLVSLLISSCGPGRAFGPTLTPTPTMTLTPMPTEAPTLTPTLTPAPTDTPTPTPLPEIKTSQGKVVITKVELTKESFLGNAGSGYQYLIIWFDNAEGSEQNASIGGGFFEACKGLYVAYEYDSAPSKVYCNAGGLFDGKLMAGFKVRDGAENFTLFWSKDESLGLTVSP